MGRGNKQQVKSELSGLKPVMSPAETARFLRISTRTLANWRSSGRGPAFLKAGGRVAYRAASVVEWTRQQEIEGSGGEGLSKVKITTRPYPKDPKRLHVDIMFPHPHTPDRDIRRRLLAPDGMDSNAARAWGMRQVREFLKDLGKSTHAEEKEDKPANSPRRNQPPKSTHAKTLRAFWPRFFEEHVEPNLKPGSQYAYHSAWHQHIAPVLGDCPLDQIDTAAVTRLRRACKAKGHGAAYRNLTCAKVMVMVRMAAEWGEVPRDAVPQLSWEKVKSRPKCVGST